MKISIQEKLDEKGISRYELSKRIGVTYPTIDNIYKGKTTSIKLENLEAICKELGCTPNDIVEPEDPELKKRIETYAQNYSKALQKKEPTNENIVKPIYFEKESGTE